MCVLKYKENTILRFCDRLTAIQLQEKEKFHLCSSFLFSFKPKCIAWKDFNYIYIQLNDVADILRIPLEAQDSVIRRGNKVSMEPYWKLIDDLLYINQREVELGRTKLELSLEMFKKVGAPIGVILALQALQQASQNIELVACTCNTLIDDYFKSEHAFYDAANPEGFFEICSTAFDEAALDVAEAAAHGVVAATETSLELSNSIADKATNTAADGLATFLVGTDTFHTALGVIDLGDALLSMVTGIGLIFYIRDVWKKIECVFVKIANHNHKLHAKILAQQVDSCRN